MRSMSKISKKKIESFRGRTTLPNIPKLTLPALSTPQKKSKSEACQVAYR